MTYRLNYHVCPEHGWINDPNGFSYFQGYYHLFYQYYPDEPIWGQCIGVMLEVRI